MASFSSVMIGLSICVFLIAVVLNDHEIMNVAVLAFTKMSLRYFLLCSWLSVFV